MTPATTEGKLNAFPLNIKSYSYNAKDVMRFFAGRRCGIFELGDNLKVEKNGDNGLRVNKGWGWLGNGREFGVSFWSEEPIDLDVNPPQNNDVYNRVVISWDIEGQDKLPSIEVRASEEGAYPELIQSETKWELCIAEFIYPAGESTLADVEPIDTRGNEELCPLVDEESLFQRADKAAKNAEQAVGDVKGVLLETEAVKTETEQIKAEVQEIAETIEGFLDVDQIKQEIEQIKQKLNALVPMSNEEVEAIVKEVLKGEENG